MEPIVNLTLYRDRATAVYNQLHRLKPPVASGPRESTGLSRKQVTRIKRATDYLNSLGPVYMYTLTFPSDATTDVITSGSCEVREAIPHDVAAKHFSNWWKRVKYAYGRDVRYVWVAEIQPKRLRARLESAIHYHVLTDLNLSINFLHTSWSGVLGRQGVIHKKRGGSSAYLAKYVTKEDGDDSQRIRGNRCGMSHSMSEALKPVEKVGFMNADSDEVAQVVYHTHTKFNLRRPGFTLWHWGFKSGRYLE